MRECQRLGTRFGILAALLASGARADAQQLPAVNRGVAFLSSAVRGSNGSGAGETALAALAMIKAELPSTDPALVAAIRTVEGRFNGSAYKPEKSGGVDVYEAAVVIMALANLDPNGYKAQISSAADHIRSKQNGNGSWDYSMRTSGDCSISQYALLGLWEAENAGIPVNPAIWDRAADFYIKAQGPQGSWNYHRDETPQYPETLSMTAAGVGSLLICQRQLQTYQDTLRVQNPYLVPLGTEAKKRYTTETSKARLSQAIAAGTTWLARNFTTTDDRLIGPTPFYCLYGIERIGALAGRDNLGSVDWYERGAGFINGKQAADGSLAGQHGSIANTSWAVLFLTKSTKKTIERIRVRRLGAGELFGGKGLPKDLSTISEAGGRLIARPMDGAVEGMLAVLEDPRSENADSALAGLLARYEASGPAGLRPYRDRFRKLLTDRDPGVRGVAAWALGRLGDLALVPILADALRDPDDQVVVEIRRSLQLLSRKVDGFGPPSPSTPEQREAAAKAWRAWYDAVRPLKVDRGEAAGGPGGTGR